MLFNHIPRKQFLFIYSKLAILLLVLLQSCAAPRKPEIEFASDYDRLEGIRRTYTVGNLAASKQTADGQFDYEVFLNVLRLDWRTGELYYYLVVRYNGREWLTLNTNRPLVLFLDAKRMSLAGEGLQAAVRERLQDGDMTYMSEQGRYQISPRQLQDLVNAGEVRVQLEGKKQTLELTLAENARQVIREFVARQVDHPQK